MNECIECGGIVDEVADPENSVECSNIGCETRWVSDTRNLLATQKLNKKLTFAWLFSSIVAAAVELLDVRNGLAMPALQIVGGKSERNKDKGSCVGDSI